MYIKTLSSKRKEKLLTLPDLTDPKFGTHAVNIALNRIIEGLAKNSKYPDPTVFRSERNISVYSNFDSLLFPKNITVRSSAHTLYITDDTVLRSHTSSMIPMAISEMKVNLKNDIILCCPGICFRNSCSGKLHSNTPHQVDIWRFIRSDSHLDSTNLYEIVGCIVNSIFVNSDVQFAFIEIEKDTSVSHPYLSQVFKIRVPFQKKMVSVGEAGVVNHSFLSSIQLDHVTYSAISVGIMLDRAVMVEKGVPDIRLLRSKNSKIAQQMKDLTPYSPVSKFPAAIRDISIAVNKEKQHGDICDAIEKILGDKTNLLEKVNLISETSYKDLPSHAVERLDMTPEDKNILVRLTFRSNERTLHGDEVDEIITLLIHNFS